MKMQLFEIRIVREDDPPFTYVVAPSEARAVEFIREHHERIGIDYASVGICRIDETLADDERIGLGDMLDSAPVGFASPPVPGIGWLAHTATVHRLRFYRIEDQSGETTYVIAPNPDVASAVWATRLDLQANDTRLYRIFDETEHTAVDAAGDLNRLLEFGPIGRVIHNENGWALAN